MLRKSISIKINNPNLIKQQLLLWAQHYHQIFWFDSNQNTQITSQKYQDYDAVLALDSHREIACDYQNAFKNLKEFQSQVKDYLFGYLSYDLKNDIENLNSHNYDGLAFADLYFIQPKKILFLNGDELTLKYLSPYSKELEQDANQILDQIISSDNENASKKPLVIQSRITELEYHQKVQNILEHIHRGDIYEVNFCQEFYAEQAQINPLRVYQKLNAISNPPFASFLKLADQYLLSASPERFVKRHGDKIISQPIKGTAKRLENNLEDKKLATKLAHDDKERAENIMIVDLVRNDLSKTACKGSVQVEELCKVYSFKQVHQLISTIVSQVKKDTHSVDILRSLFPMGSMTGAPKISAMQIIEEEEETKRGLYSGAVGYISPNQDFDFNVVIRSILYNASNQYLSFSVGGAITAKSIISKEYEECLIKAEAMKKALEPS